MSLIIGTAFNLRVLVLLVQAKNIRLTKTSCMNSAKWRKLFSAIEVHGNCSFLAEVKFLADDSIYCSNTNLSIHQSGEYTQDRGIHGSLAFKDIEWIYVAAVCELERHNRGEKLKSDFIKHDILALETLIDSLGKFAYDFDEMGLKIYGYK